MVQTDDQFMLKDPQGANKFIAYDEPVSTFDTRYGLSALIDYGEIYVEGIDVGIALALQDTYYQLVVWSPGGPAGVDGEANGAVPDVSNDHITIAKSGMYFVRFHISCYSTLKNEYEFEVHKNNGTGAFHSTEAYRTTSVASAIGLVSGGGICDLTAADTIELWVERKDGAGVSKTITIRQATLSVMQIGD